ncbi:XRE family transcriptional regulator [Gordonia amicalis]|uniref:XRE family transcriptional regulator n=1 Tax=Gordonia amicalis TaxID=89053 RepID=UPI00295445B3|nr:XRE family transcriptional regulator [Gordonia amicalis]MDV7102714.1 XRE family transcriptional regulator [Gordonia amicalis]
MINPNQRLRNLRQLNGMTQKAFAAELGIGQAALSQIERGDRPLTAEHMVIARRRFNIPFDFFEAPPITYGPNDLNYRTRKLTRPQQDRAAVTFGLIEQAVRGTADVSNATGSLDATNCDDLRARPHREIEALAAAARQLIGIRSDKVINNVTRCIERLQILVTGLPAWEPNARIDGISSPRRTEEPFVVALDLDKPGDRLRFSAAHELGHVLIHTESKPVSREARETEADMFASAFLLPREAMLDELAPTLTLAGYSRIKARWGVSMQAVIRRSFDLGVIDRDRYRSLQIQISSRGWRRAEPVDIPSETPALPTPDIGGFRQITHADNVVSIFDRPNSG